MQAGAQDGWFAAPKVRRVNVELTTRCNAACPQCARNLWGGEVNPNLPLCELRATDVRVILPPAFLQQLDYVNLCGNYGDPMVAQDTAEILQYLRAGRPRLLLRMATNGSGRSAAWWRRIARTGTVCRFGIDGLEDTNARYRRRTDWGLILKAVDAFVGAGGEAEWDFIVFRHNEHQVEQAAALARRLGFRKFFVKRTSRFGTGGGTPVRGRDGVLEGLLEPPESPAYRNPVTESETFRSTHASRAAHRAFLATTPIRCRACTEGFLYVSAEGLVFPCAFAAQIYPRRFPSAGGLRHWVGRLRKPPVTRSPWEVLREIPGGKRSINVLCAPIEEVLSGIYFRELVPRGWAGATPKLPRLSPCPVNCGTHPAAQAQEGESLI